MGRRQHDLLARPMLQRNDADVRAGERAGGQSSFALRRGSVVGGHPGFDHAAET